jgi:hypothetical protein
MLFVPEICQRSQRSVGHCYDIASIAPITAGWAAPRHKFLTSEGNLAMAAISATDRYFD